MTRQFQTEQLMPGKRKAKLDSKQRVKATRPQAGMQNSPAINSLCRNNDCQGVGHPTSADLHHFKPHIPKSEHQNTIKKAYKLLHFVKHTR
jgi:hypothetical protein